MTLVFNTKGQRYLRVGLAVPLLGSVSNLRSMVAEEGSISSNQVPPLTHTHTLIIGGTEWPFSPVASP